jgi:hypothetical protein
VARVDEGQPQVEIERSPLRGRDVNASPEMMPAADPAAAALERRAKRQGFALMVASSIVTLLLLGGAWVLLRP